MSKRRGIFNNLKELYEYYGKEKADKLFSYNIGLMLVDSEACDLYRNADNDYTDEDEAEFIALVGEDVARRIMREQPENYPIMVSHWCFMKSDVIREND